MTLTLATLNRCSAAQFVERLGEVWEHAPWVTEAIAGSRPFPSVDALHRAMVDVVARRDEVDRVALFCGHPELAGADARAGTMTADSLREQGGLALTALSDDAARRWDALNAAYRTRFGFPFILCIRRHTRASALRTFERRLDNDRTTELAETLAEIGHITRLRLAARIADHGLGGIAGNVCARLTDATRGGPASGVLVELYVLEQSRMPLATGHTGPDGRIELPLPPDTPLRIGDYALRVHVGDYLRAAAGRGDGWPFLDVVPVGFGIAEPAGRYRLAIEFTASSFAMRRLD